MQVVKMKIALLLLLGCGASYAYAQDLSDTGSSNPLRQLQNEISNLRIQLEKDLPRDVKYELLSAAKKQIVSIPANQRAEAMMIVADEFRRFMFLDQARPLYEEVVLSNMVDANQKILATQYLAEIAFVDDKDTGKAIELLNRAIDLCDGATTKKGELLVKLGSFHFINGEEDKMVLAFQEFNTLPDQVRNALPTENLKANLYIARALKEKNDVESAMYYSEVQKIIDDNIDHLEKDLALSISLELDSNRVKWNDDKRIEKLVSLFRSKLFGEEQRICVVGNEIYWAYFLDCEAEWERYRQFHDDFLDRLKSLAAGESGAAAAEARRFACQSVLAYAFACQSAKKQFSVNTLRKEFDDWSKGQKKFQVNLPEGASKKEYARMQVAIRVAAEEILKVNRKND